MTTTEPARLPADASFEAHAAFTQRTAATADLRKAIDDLTAVWQVMNTANEQRHLYPGELAEQLGVPLSAMATRLIPTRAERALLDCRNAQHRLMRLTGDD